MRLLFLILTPLVSLLAHSQVKTVHYSELEKIENSCIWFKKGENIPFTGKVVNYYGNKKLKSEVFLTNGIANGIQVIYYKNGNKKSETTIVDGQKHGTHTVYFKNGDVQFVKHFENGAMHGTFVAYKRNGEVLFQDQYIHGNLLTQKFITESN